ncbi:MAG: radical SAM protein [Nannocystaceae bacterium]
MKALIKVGYRCNDHCSFCHTLEVRHIDADTAEIDAKIHRAAALGHTMIVLSGGEPTIRPELVHWARLSASLGLDFGLVTNGRMLAYADVVDELCRHRLRYVYLSLHGGNAKIHNLMVRSDAFEQTFGALRNLSGRGLDLHVNCVITRHNVDHLIPLVEAVLPYRDATIKFSMVEPKGGGDRLFDHLMPRVDHVARRVREAIAHGDAKAGAEGPRFRHGALPLCLLPGLEDRFDDLKTHRYRTMIEVGEPDFFPVDDDNKIHPLVCDGCALKGPCPGLYRGYHEAFGDGELVALRGRPRSNSYNYVFEGLVSEAAAEGCPLRDGDVGVTPWERGRDLFVRNGARVGRYRAESRDFSDREVATIKHEYGQVYVDVSRKAAPDDFARDLVKLERSRVCDGCPHAAACTGLYEPLAVDVFSRDDAAVRGLLAGLVGDVLDLGCGDAPYLDVLAPRIASGAITYLGLDPDVRRVAALRPRLCGGELRAAAAEALAAPGDPLALGERAFDHLLILRSWNHLEDPEAVLQAMVPRLRAGASIVVVDNVPFGLARGALKSRRAESSAAGLEHLRCDDAGQAAARIAAALGDGATMIERRDVGPTTSNQWLLRYRLAPRQG